MLRDVMLKEIHDTFVNYRFVAASLACIALIIVSVAVMTGEFRERLRDYRSRVQEQDEFIDHYGHMNRSQWMGRTMREPEIFEILAPGLPSGTDEENFVSNPASRLLARLDFASIVLVVVSLMAVLFTYSTISGEREAGTLRLMLASGVSRTTAIAGKFLGGVACMLIPFTLGYAAGIVYLLLAGGMALDGTMAGVLALLLAVSWLYVSVFTGLGLFCSSLSATSGQAVLKGLFGWVILVLVIPNVSPFLAAQLSSVPSATWVEQTTTTLTDVDRDRIIQARTQELRTARYPDLASLPQMTKLDIETRVTSDNSFRERYAAYSRDYEDLVRSVNREQMAKAMVIVEDFEQRSKAQERLATVLASLSPAGDLTFLLTQIAGTGIEAHDRWNRKAAEYSRVYGSYVDSRYHQEQLANPAFGSNDYLDLRGRPRFSYTSPNLGERLLATLPHLSALVIFVVLFPVAALISIMRYDVR